MFREDIVEPLGADFEIGLAEEHDARIADLVPPVGLPTDLGEPSALVIS